MTTDELLRGASERREAADSLVVDQLGFGLMCALLDERPAGGSHTPSPTRRHAVASEAFLAEVRGGSVVTTPQGAIIIAVSRRADL